MEINSGMKPVRVTAQRHELLRHLAERDGSSMGHILGVLIEGWHEVPTVFRRRLAVIQAEDERPMPMHIAQALTEYVDRMESND